MHFKDYAKYYNLLYRDKNYKEEVDYIDRLIKKFNPQANSLFDLGCGTGKHVFAFEDLNYNVTGMDISEQMIAIAKEAKKSLNSGAVFFNGDIRNYRGTQKYDAVVSLFHVMSYQTSNEDIENAFLTAKKCLANDGVFIFDCWYGPGVLIDLPVSRTRIFEDDNLYVKRTSRAEIDINSNIVEVIFDVEVQDKVTNEKTFFEEVHPMRYLFKPEIELFASKSGMRIMAHYHWMTTETPTERSWYCVSILKNN